MARLGSFAAPVALPEHLRPWRAAGLETLLLPGGPPERVAPCAVAASALVAAAADQPPRSAAPVQSWPEPWASLAARVRAKPQIIITYASLTADVTGQADPVRRKLFQSILTYLAWPQGTSLFWPCVDVPGGQPVARNIFLTGVLHFGVAHIACFGHEAAAIVKALFPDEGPRQDVCVHSLPEPESLLGLLPHELHRAVASLKALDLA